VTKFEEESSQKRNTLINGQTGRDRDF